MPAAITAAVNVVKAKPVTILALAHALLMCALAFDVVQELDAGQLVAIEGVFAALGFTASTQVTANTRLDEATLKSVQRQPWAGPLTVGPPDE